MRDGGSTMLSASAGAHLAGDLQRAAMQLDQCAGNGRSQPRAFKFARQRAVKLAEGLQRRGDGFLGHADAGILDGESEAAFFAEAEPQAHFAVRGT